MGWKFIDIGIHILCYILHTLAVERRKKTFKMCCAKVWGTYFNRITQYNFNRITQNNTL